MQVECSACGRGMRIIQAAPALILQLLWASHALPASTQEGTTPYDQDATAARQFAGEAAQAGSDLPPEIRGYRLLGLLGSGGMGAVYQAEDLSSGRRVALKLIGSEFTSSTSAVERFRQEGRLASLIAHPRCVFVLAADEDAGRPYIVMELMPGSTLQELVEKQGSLPQTEAVAKTLDVIEGLQEAHRLGVIHRDVKPSNCFVLDDGRVKIGDFGLAKSLIHTGSLTRTGTFLGTLLYAPPEQIKGETIDVRTDVYLGACCHRCISCLPAALPIRARMPRPSWRAPSPNRRPRCASTAASCRRLWKRWCCAAWAASARSAGATWKNCGWATPAIRCAWASAPRRLCGSLRGVRPRHAGVSTSGVGAHPGRAGLVGLALGTPGPIVRGIHALELLPWWLLEGWFGWSPGKWLLHLRVCTPASGDPPGLGRAALRFLVFYVCLLLPMDLFDLIPLRNRLWRGSCYSSRCCRSWGAVGAGARDTPGTLRLPRSA